MPDDLQAVHEQLDSLSKQMAETCGDVRVIRALMETEGQRCAYREKIDQAGGLVTRVVRLEDRLVALEIRVAGIAAASGIIVSIITTLVIGALKGAP